ncbi:hypothetical protein EVG20_g6079 [Dentipellis fragilis]|uniref:Uncharacterized protein n=1 Tax=Dentipellis fragilis TaxID=205917 RepID=A0A4Y9YR62_9AGAM|nr:hypothetical protein EVG20_g6079 [Dentipellis fragilis]
MTLERPGTILNFASIAHRASRIQALDAAWDRRVNGIAILPTRQAPHRAATWPHASEMDIAPSSFCEQRCLHPSCNSLRRCCAALILARQHDGNSAPISHQSHKPSLSLSLLPPARPRPTCIGRRSAWAALSPLRAKGNVPARMGRRHPIRVGATRAPAEVPARGSQLESIVQRPGRTAAHRPPYPPSLHRVYVSPPARPPARHDGPPFAQCPRALSPVAHCRSWGADGLPAASFTCVPTKMDVRGSQITQLPENKALHWTHTSADMPIPMPTWPGVTSSPVPCEISPPRSTLRIPEAL